MVQPIDMQPPFLARHIVPQPVARAWAFRRERLDKLNYKVSNGKIRILRETGVTLVGPG
jgi:hypothetical protein